MALGITAHVAEQRLELKELKRKQFSEIAILLKMYESF
jgi:hypothetical protein